jgi:hypothetical protein
MQLVVATDGGKVDFEKVIRAVREAGFEAKRK